MKYALVVVFIMFIALCQGLESTQTGPVADVLNYANYNQFPFSFGGVSGGVNLLYLSENDIWNSYASSGTGLKITGTWKLNNDTLMVAMGSGSWSDGVWNFNLVTHTWTINDWFFYPNFVQQCSDNGSYYVGERDGLFKSTNASDWTRVTAIGSGECNSFVSRDSCIVVNRDTFVFYSHDRGQTWLQSDTGYLKGFRYTSDGVLYGIMDAGSDSDGLWRSNDDGATWNVVLYTTGLSCIGPDYLNYIPLGWNTVNEMGGFVALMNTEYQLIPLNDASLYSPVKQMDIFPLVNTMSFYVINSAGCFFLTGFLPSETADEVITPVPEIRLYPNPANEICYFKFNSVSHVLPIMQIYNLKGQLVRTLSNAIQEKVKVTRMSWDLHMENGVRATSGVYFIVMRDISGKRLGCAKLVVVK